MVNNSLFQLKILINFMMCFLEYTQMVNNIQIAFDRATKKYFDQNSSDEEQVLLEYPPIIEPVNKLKPSTTAIKVQKSDDKKSKHNNSSNNNNNNNSSSHKKSVRSDSSSQEDNNDDNDNDDEKEITVVEKINKKIKKKDEKKSSAVVKEKEKNTLRGKRKRDKDDSENASKSKKSKKSADHEEDIKDNEIISVSSKKVEAKKSKKIKEKEIVLATELKPNKKSKNKKLVDSTPSPSKIIKQKQSKQNKKSSPVKSSSKSEKEKLKNNHNNKYFDSSDMSSDNESIRDLINEDFKDDDDDHKEEEVNKVEDHKKDNSSNKNNNKKQKPIKDTKKSAKSLKKHKKSAKNEEPHHKANKSAEDAFSMSGSERSKSPIIPSIVDDFDSSMERKELSEIKDKYDLIKERRNKHLQQDKSVKSAKESSTTSSSNKKEKSSHKDKHVKDKDKKKDEKLSVFDELLAEKHSENYKQHFGSNEKSKTENNDKEEPTKPSKKHSKKDSRKVPVVDVKPAVVNEVVKQKGSKKQNKASLDVLDMETEQTLKDINKWLEHTPRFEYNSASNSPSRYVIEDIDMHSKIDDNDFRKPIPLLPSSPSTSNKVFHSPTQKDDKILKDTNNKGVQGPSSAASIATNAIANKKALKESKRKNLKDKLQPAPKKKELQRTIDRLQPGKTKGNLLSNIQNINKPEELFPLGNREKVKEIKSSLTVEPDLSGPQLNLGKVLDTSTFNLYDPKQEKECFSDTEPCERKSLSDSSIKGEDLFEKVENIESKSPNEKDSTKIGDLKVPAECNNSASDSSSSTKPNLNAWFKAFGMPKKPKSVEEPVKKLIDNETKLESSYTSNRQRKLSTGSSMSERSSVEDSPHVSLEERGAPAPFPSPIGASPMSASPMSASPKPEENSIQKTNYPINPINSSTRVGFYQDTTSTKSSPDKSCSPREMLSPYHGHFSQQPNAYANPTNASNSDAYSNFYNPEAANKQRQTSYSKQTNSPTPYYDQYKQPMSQESDFNNSMSPNTNPNSPYHSQQSSPYQQQPNSPYQQQSSNGSGTNIAQNSANMISTRSPNYSQPNSPYQQNNNQAAAVSPFNQQQAPQVVSQQPTATPQTNQQQPNFNNQHYNSLFNQPQQPEITQFSPNPQQTDPKMPSNPTYNMQQQKPPIASAMYNNNNQLQQAPVIAPTKTQIPNAANVMSNMQQQPMMYPESLYVDQNKNRNYGINKKPELQQPTTAPTIAPVNEVPRFNAAEQKIDENPKYLDLSKQTNRQHPQYQQAPVATAYSKPEYDKNASYEMLARSMQKNAGYASAMDACSLPNEISYDAVQKNVPTYGVNSAVSSGPTESIKDLTKSSSLSNLMQNPPASNLMYQAHQTAKPTHPTSMDYKSSPLFNTPSASSMMELTAFMRDFRQADDRFSSFPNPSSGFYDKPITPSHMFGKNISSSASTLQQMFSNPMTTMAYGREQQEYQNRLNAFQAANNTPTPTPVSQMPADNKPKKSKKSKKNASPEILPPAASQHPSMSQHQMPTNQQQSHQSQFAMHQQSFQSFAGLKIPSASSSSSADPMKSVVPGSAFNYGPSPLGLYGENSPYLDEFRGAQGSYYPPALRSSEPTDKTTPNPPQAHPAAPSSPYHHLLPSHHPPRSYPFMNSIDPATLQQQYRMMFNQTYQAGYHLGMHNQPPWHM